MSAINIPDGPSRGFRAPLLVVPDGLPDEALLAKVRAKAREGWDIRQIAAMSEPDPARRAEWLEPAHVQALDLWETQGWRWYDTASRADIPRLYWTARLDGPAIEQTPAIQAVRQFWDAGAGRDEGSALCLCGATGCGKTFGQVAGIHHSKLRDVAFSPFGRLVRQLLDQDQREEALERAIETDVLMIDDFGAAYLKTDGLAEALLEEMLSERELARKWTCITTNLRETQLVELVGDRIADRLAGEWGRIVEVSGPSLRRQRPSTRPVRVAP